MAVAAAVTLAIELMLHVEVGTGKAGGTVNLNVRFLAYDGCQVKGGIEFKPVALGQICSTGTVEYKVCEEPVVVVPAY